MIFCAVRLFIGCTVILTVASGPIRNYRDVDETVVEESEQTAGTTIHFVKPREVKDYKIYF